MGWTNIYQIPPQAYDCGYCGFHVASAMGYSHSPGAGAKIGAVMIPVCPHCQKPTVLIEGRQLPGNRPGEPVANLPKDIEAAYNEARDCIAASAHTAAAMLARKLLMHIAVGQGAAANLSFKAYVDYLATNGFVPPNGKAWVDHIRERGNEANHELVFVNASDAGEILGFIEMLLKFIYEFPAKIGAKAPPPTT
jgi:hypothetical protein